MPCDGCRRLEEADDDSEDPYEVELETCEDCGWSVCDDCSCNESRGVCKCLNSDMGSAYCDMDGPQWYMGANGGARYAGPFKCLAQRNGGGACDGSVRRRCLVDSMQLQQLQQISRTRGCQAVRALPLRNLWFCRVPKG